MHFDPRSGRSNSYCLSDGEALKGSTAEHFPQDPGGVIRIADVTRRKKDACYQTPTRNAHQIKNTRPGIWGFGAIPVEYSPTAMSA